MITEYALKPIRKVVTLLCLLTSFVANAYDFNYTYVQIFAGKATDKSTDIDIDSDIVGIAGSFNIVENAAITIGYSKSTPDAPYTKSYATDIGITLHSAINNSTDYLFNVSAIIGQIEDDPTYTDDSDSGFSLIGGVRHAANKNIELDFSASYSEIFSITSKIIEVGIRYNFSHTASIGASYAAGTDVNAYAGDIRINF